MDWLAIVKTDWEIYAELDRIKQYVIFGKIDAEQFRQVTGTDYEE